MSTYWMYMKDEKDYSGPSTASYPLDLPNTPSPPLLTTSTPDSLSTGQRPQLVRQKPPLPTVNITHNTEEYHPKIHASPTTLKPLSEPETPQTVDEPPTSHLSHTATPAASPNVATVGPSPVNPALPVSNGENCGGGGDVEGTGNRGKLPGYGEQKKLKSVGVSNSNGCSMLCNLV